MARRWKCLGGKSWWQEFEKIAFQFRKDKSLINQIIPSIRQGKKKTFSLRGGGGPQIGEVTCGGSPHLSCKRDQIKKWQIIWTGRLPHLSGLPHLPGGPPPPCKQALNPNINFLLQCLYIICRYKGFFEECKLFFGQEPQQLLQIKKSTSYFE